MIFMKFKLWLLLVTIMFIPLSSAQHTYDTKAQAVASTSPVNLSYTAGTGADVLVVGLAIVSLSARAGGSPTYNGASLTKANVTQTAVGEVSAELWYLLSPPNGSAYTISVPNTGSLTIRVMASSYHAAAGKTSVLDNAWGFTHTEANPSNLVTTSANGDVIVDIFAHGKNSAETGQSQTLLYATDEGAWNSAGQYALQVTAGNIWFNHTIAADNAAHIIVAFKEQSSTPAQSYIPPTPISCSATTGNFYVNSSCGAGAGNVTNGMNMTNGTTWKNNTVFWMNNTRLAHAWDNVSFYAFNNSNTGTLNITPATLNTQIPNNVPIMNAIGNKNANEGTWLNFTISGTDVDSDSLSCSTNATKGTLTSCNFNWSITYDDAYTYNWTYYLNDSYGGSDSETIIVTINDVQPTYIPPTPINIAYTNGSIWVNHTWQAGVGNITNSYNVSHNGAWTNDSVNLFFNVTVGYSSWSNITTYAFNNSGAGTLNLTGISQNVLTPLAPPPTYSVSGFTFDNESVVLASVTVSYSGGSNTSIATGSYAVTGILNGTYIFTASKTGYSNHKYNITINGVNLTNQNFSLAPISGGGGATLRITTLLGDSEDAAIWFLILIFGALFITMTNKAKSKYV